jgi:predicted acylesterase/phospholipase RssA
MVLAVAGLQGCATSQMYHAVPAQLSEAAQIPDMNNVRLWGDAGAETTARLFRAEAPRIKAKYAARAKAGRPLESNILALSGGADDGAFGSGLLVGWGERGTRPEFDLVTGVSTGALIAPFVFIGRDYDPQLAEIFVKYRGEDIYKANILTGVLGGVSVADNAPLARLIEHYVDRRLLARIAAERAKGRVLLVGTTNLNAQRPVYWDMGKIAQAGSPKALDLFRHVLLASAALPGIFPPVHIEVMAGGKTFHEMHVDGGPTREVFFSPDQFNFGIIDAAVGQPIRRRLWIVRNGKLAPEYANVKETAFAVAARSLETLTKSQGIGDLIRMHDKADRDGIDYNLAYIPANFTAPRSAPFDPAYMQALYANGYEAGRKGAPWVKAPPGLSAVANKQ